MYLGKPTYNYMQAGIAITGLSGLLGPGVVGETRLLLRQAQEPWAQALKYCATVLYCLGEGMNQFFGKKQLLTKCKNKLWLSWAKLSTSFAS